MILGEVRTFPKPKHDKEQVMKIQEEACEVFSAWEDWQKNDTDGNLHHLINECTDVIMATSNLLASLGIYNLQPWMLKCETHNVLRGRYDIPE